MSNVDLISWVGASKTETELQFRQAIHTIVSAMAADGELADMSFMKGGILLALRYHSPRYTQDIDFSTPKGWSQEEADHLVKRLSRGLAEAVDRLGYELDCKIQSAKPDPKPKETFTHFWINLKVSIGYAKRGSRDHKNLMRNQARRAVQMDYSFDERVPTKDIFQVGSDGLLRVYALTTLIAEKYRAMLQQVSRDRARRQDVFDLYFLLSNYDLRSDECRLEVLEVLRMKAEDRGVDVTQNAIANPEVIERARKEYPSLANELDEGILPAFDQCYSVVRAYYEELPWGSDVSPQSE